MHGGVTSGVTAVALIQPGLPSRQSKSSSRSSPAAVTDALDAASCRQATDRTKTEQKRAAWIRTSPFLPCTSIRACRITDSRLSGGIRLEVHREGTPVVARRHKPPTPLQAEGRHAQWAAKGRPRYSPDPVRCRRLLCGFDREELFSKGKTRARRPEEQLRADHARPKAQPKVAVSETESVPELKAESRLPSSEAFRVSRSASLGARAGTRSPGPRQDLELRSPSSRSLVDALGASSPKPLVLRGRAREIQNRERSKPHNGVAHKRRRSPPKASQRYNESTPDSSSRALRDR